MHKSISKKNFFKKLEFYLSFYFDDDESMNILHDYEEWFINETLQGKTEEEICFSLNSPQKVVNNLLAESESNLPRMKILLQNTIIQTFLLLMIHFLINILLLKICSRNSSNYLYFALGIVFVYFVIGITFIKIKFPCKLDFNKSIFYRNNLFVFGFTIVIILFQILFLPKINYAGSGKLCFLVFSVFILSLFLINIYFVAGKFFQVKQMAFFTTLHILGVTTLLFYIINQLNLLYNDMSQCSILIGGSSVIYLETLILCYIFYIQKHIRKL